MALAFEEHPEVDWGSFALHARSPLGVHWNETLRGVVGGALGGDGGALRALRAEGGKVWTRFLWTSVNPVAAEFGRRIAEAAGETPPDAWDTLMDILAWRL